jgi:RNA polymerase sigma-70 factor (ECF subfamily)
VLRALHLLFNEGYWSGSDGPPIRADLCRLALGLGRSLLEAYPDVPEVTGLLALMLFHDARRPARLGEGGQAIPLPEQDRSRWDHEAIADAAALLERALSSAQPGAFQTEAAIVAVHCRAANADETDWREVAALYELLEHFRPGPAVRVNRAFALARAEGPRAGLILLDEPGRDLTSQYPYVHLVRGTLLGELGSLAAARAELQRAEQLARNDDEREQIRRRLAELCDENGERAT